MNRQIKKLAVLLLLTCSIFNLNQDVRAINVNSSDYSYFENPLLRDTKENYELKRDLMLNDIYLTKKEDKIYEDKMLSVRKDRLIDNKNVLLAVATPDEDVDNKEVKEELKVLEKEEAPRIPLSPVERMYKEHNGVTLHQFGYNIFKEKIEPTSIDENRTLQPGDQLVLSVWGEAVDILIANQSFLKPTLPLSIDREGFINIPTIGTVFLTGLDRDEAELAIQEKFDEKYMGIFVDLKVDQASTVPINIVGEVKNPGTVMVSSSSGIINALAKAGGIKKTGSLRNIEITNSNRKVIANIDLYDFIQGGEKPLKPFNTGYTIIVPPLENVVALDGGVSNPGIYEFKPNERVINIIEFAGGILPSLNRHRAQVQTFNISDNSIELKDYSFSFIENLPITNGDLFKFFDSEKKVENYIVLSGNVYNPGVYELKKDMKLSEVITDKAMLKSETYEYTVEVTREEGLSKTPVVLSFSLEKVLNGSENLTLQSKDEIKVFKNTLMPKIRVSGAIEEPQVLIYETNMRLLDVLGKVKLLYPQDDVAVEVTNESGNTQLIYLYELLTLNNTNLNIDILPFDKVFVRPIEKLENAKTVTITGRVNRPGVYKLTSGLRFNDLVQKAGGLSEDSYLNGVVFVRKGIRKAQSQILDKLINIIENEILEKNTKIMALENDDKNKQNAENYLDNQKQLIENLRNRNKDLYGRLIVNIDDSNIDELNIKLKEGDVIYIPDRPDYILIAGEVWNQSAVMYEPDRTVKQYINLVGGFTKKAAKKQAYISKANGFIVSYRQGRSKFLSAKLDPGDAIVVPAKTKLPVDVRGIFKDFADIISKAGTSVFILTKI